MVSEAFVRFFVEIVGHYSLFLTPAEREERTLQREAFRKAVSSKSLRRFLEVFMETQMFGGFIQERELRKQGVRGEGLCGPGSPAVAPGRREMPPAPSPAAWPPAGGSVPVQRHCKGGGREGWWFESSDSLVQPSGSCSAIFCLCFLVFPSQEGGEM